MPENMQKPLLAAALGKKTTRYPVWFLRQAGRYLPEYQAIRAQHDFLTVCKTPTLAAEVTLQPLRRFDLDAAIIFSDILLPLVGMGINLSFDSGHGPVLTPAMKSPEDGFKKLRPADGKKDIGYVGESLELVKSKLAPHQTLIGFAGAPLTTISYLIEGRTSKEFTNVKRWFYQWPGEFAELLAIVCETLYSFIEMQVKAGAEAIMFFDSWASQCSILDYQTYVSQATFALISRVKSLGVPVIFYPGQGGDLLSELGKDLLKRENIPEVIAVDWRISLKKAFTLLQAQGIVPSALQGNLDPTLLIAPESLLRARVQQILSEAQSLPVNHIFNVGHGLKPFTPIESLDIVLDEIRGHC